MSEETIPQMRERINALEKELKAANDATAQANSRARLFEAKDGFREAGYNPKHAELFVKANPEGDITPELVTTFADEYGLAPAATGESTPAPEGETSTPDPNAELAALGRAGSRAGEGGAATAETQKLTNDEWQKLNKENPAAALEAARKGRVEISEGNFYAQQLNR